MNCPACKVPFCSSGSLLSSAEKSKLMSRIEKLPHKDSNAMDISEDDVNSPQYLPHITQRIDNHRPIHHAIIIDGMVVVHELPCHGLKTMTDLGVKVFKRS